MKAGVLKETWPGETRVAIVPGVIPALVKAGIDVVVEPGAGDAAGFPDAQYVEKGATLASRETVLADCSEAFLEHFHRADLIIAKGQGNYETLSQVAAPIFFLFTVKCPLVAAHIGLPTGTLVAKPTPAFPTR